MIGKRLRAFFTRFWMDTASGPRSGSRFIQTMPPVFCGGFTAALAEVDRRAMRENLTNKYGIREIEE